MRCVPLAEWLATLSSNWVSAANMGPKAKPPLPQHAEHIPVPGIPVCRLPNAWFQEKGFMVLPEPHSCNVPLQDFAKLPWELDMPHDKAASVLGSYLGVSSLEPASVLDLDVDQITGQDCWRRATLLPPLPPHNHSGCNSFVKTRSTRRACNSPEVQPKPPFGVVVSVLL